MFRQFRAATRLERIAVIACAVVLGAFVADRADAREARTPRPGLDPLHAPALVMAAPESIVRNVPDSLLGRSGKLFFRYLRPTRPLALTYLSRFFGDSATRKPGVYRVAEAAVGGKPFSFITLVPLLLCSLVARLFVKLDYLSLSGLLAGSMTDPPALAFATAVTRSDAPSIAYASVYPFTMLLRIVVAQVLVMLM